MTRLHSWERAQIAAYLQQHEDATNADVATHFERIFCKAVSEADIRFAVLEALVAPPAKPKMLARKAPASPTT